MITIPTSYSQQSWRWWWHKVGGYSNFWSIGCTTTCLAMLLEMAGSTLTPPQVEEALTQVNGYLWVKQMDKWYPTGLLVWDKIALGFPKIQFVERYRVYDNTKVLDLIYDEKVPVLVEVRHPYGYQHWVLYIGGYMAIDPLGGRLISTAKYPAIGFADLRMVK